MTNTSTEATIYLREISNLQASIKTLLSNMREKINAMPDLRDHTTLINELEEIKNMLDKFYLELHDFMKSCSSLDNNIKDQLDKAIVDLNSLSTFLKKDSQKHRNNVKDIHNLICNDDINFSDTINELNILLKKVNVLLQNLDIKYNKNITADDINALIELAHRSKQRYEYWTPKKKALLWFGGIFVGSILFLNKLVTLFNFFMKLL